MIPEYVGRKVPRLDRRAVGVARRAGFALTAFAALFSGTIAFATAQEAEAPSAETVEDPTTGGQSPPPGFAPADEPLSAKEPTALAEPAPSPEALDQCHERIVLAIDEVSRIQEGFRKACEAEKADLEQTLSEAKSRGPLAEALRELWRAFPGTEGEVEPPEPLDVAADVLIRIKSQEQARADARQEVYDLKRRISQIEEERDRQAVELTLRHFPCSAISHRYNDAGGLEVRGVVGTLQEAKSLVDALQAVHGTPLDAIEIATLEVKACLVPLGDGWALMHRGNRPDDSGRPEVLDQRVVNAVRSRLPGEKASCAKAAVALEARRDLSARVRPDSDRLKIWAWREGRPAICSSRGLLDSPERWKIQFRTEGKAALLLVRIVE